MTDATLDAPYTLRQIEQMLGLSRSVVAGLVEAGYVAPARGARNELRFSFQDVVLLRTALELKAARIPPARLLRSLRLLRARLPAELPLSGLRISAVGSDVVVREGSAQWEAQTGQLLMDFGVGLDAGSVTFLPAPARAGSGVDPLAVPPATPAAKPVAAPPTGAQDWFVRAQAAEASDPQEAEAAYRRALALAPQHVGAWINLGALLCESGRCREAVVLYEQAARQVPGAPLIHFNAAIALEDQHRDAEALASYRRSLELAPDLADAHYNAARLCEKLGDAQGTLRHYSAYRRLQRSAVSPA